MNMSVICLGFCWHLLLESSERVNTVTSWWTRWRLKSPASRLFYLWFVQGKIKESINALRHRPLWVEFTGDRWIPLTRASGTDTVFIWWHHHGQWMDPELNSIYQLQLHSLWHSDAKRRKGTESTLAQVMACCLTAPSHNLNQYWLIINKVLWH